MSAFVEGNSAQFPADAEENRPLKYGPAEASPCVSMAAVRIERLKTENVPLFPWSVIAAKADNERNSNVHCWQLFNLHSNRMAQRTK